MLTWLGVDLGGTDTKAVLLVGDEVAERSSTPTVRGDAADTVAGLVAVAADLVADHPGASGVGITLPGIFDDAGRAVLLPNVPGEWAGRPIVAPVADACGRPVTLINDARAFGLAEARLGVARGARTAVGVVLGTGVGGVVLCGGQLHTGARGGAGEIGHQVLVPGGPRCGCGNQGCLEALVRADVIADGSGRPTVAEAAEAAAAGDRAALAAFADAAAHLGHGLANVVTVLQPEIVFIGGGVSLAGEVLLGPLREELQRLTPLVPADSYSVTPAALGPWAGAIGAALAAREAVA